ncbi:MAG: hypothetical protein Q7J07_05705 [Pelolinea sp.]|nr:hypothetical protein [Pelolinea sp.]
MHKNLKTTILISITGGLVIGLVVALINPGKFPAVGFITAAMITALSLFLLQYVTNKLGGNRQLTVAVFLAFSLRLFIGILLFSLLPSFGYDEPYNNAGYLYLDAYQRDTDAWNLAQSDAPVTAAFQEEFSTDQYGGLLTLTAGVYRFLSPDGHRPLLILILTSFFGALGIPFFWNAVKHRWDEKIANASMWIFALYPESIILGASQMREPILIGLSAIAFWGVSVWDISRKNSITAVSISLLSMVFISSKAAVAIFAAISVWFWLDHVLDRSNKLVRWFSWVSLILLILASVFLGWNWLVDSSKYDLYLMESASGRIQWELELIGEKYQVPFIISYGVAQPVLPATIVYPGIPLTRAVSIFRAAGWYMLIPLLITGFLLFWKRSNKKDKRILFLFSLTIILWTFISSARAGGDQWDNPRYRSIFLAWMAFAAGWTWVKTITKHSFWLWRIVLVEIIYSGFFIQWYLSRYYGLFKRMDFWPMIKLLLAIGAVILVGGFIFDIGYARFKESDHRLE